MSVRCALCFSTAPWLPAVHTPNMQSLADDGYTFRRMYVQQALCSPSRTVLLTGRRPDRSHVWVIGPCERCPTRSFRNRARVMRCSAQTFVTRPARTG